MIGIIHVSTLICIQTGQWLVILLVFLL